MKRLALAFVVLFGASTVRAADPIATVRVGEQDTCKVTGVTTVIGADEHGSAAIRFDLSGLKHVGAVRNATLRIWINLRSGFGRPFRVGRWNDEGFDGFKVWSASAKAGDKPLDTVYPFVSTLALHEWDVTPAVRGKAGKGAVELKTNFPLPANDFAPAWQRPYLQIEAVGEPAARPKPPSNLRAVYRSGQVFLTWKQIPHDGAFFDSTFRVYMHDEPITADNLPEATRLGEVHRNAQLNYRRTAYSYGGLGSYGTYRQLWQFVDYERKPGASKGERIKALNAKLPRRYNFVIDDAWTARKEAKAVLADFKAAGPGATMLEGPPLPDDTGLFVHTVRSSGRRWFAVTSVVEGQESRRDLTGSNAPKGPVAVRVEPPRPVLQVVFNYAREHHGVIRGGYQLRQYVWWGGPEAGGHAHLEPSTPFLFHVLVPLTYVGGRAEEPVLTVGGIYWPSPVVAVDRPYVAPTRRAPVPSLHCSLTDSGWPHARTFYYGSRRPPQPGADLGFRFPPNLGRGGMPANAYGHHDRVNTGRDPREATARPYFEHRTARAIEMFFAEFPRADRNRVLLRGQGSAFLMGIHQPDLFGSVSSAQFAPWSAPWNDRHWPLLGRRAWKLKNEKGFSVWDWNDPVWYSREFPRLVWPFIANCQSPNYAKADNRTHWANMGFPQFYLDLAAEKRGGRWWWVDIGDAPDGKGGLVPRDRAYPAFTNVNFAEVPQPQWRKEPRGTLNGYLAWGPNGALLHALRHKKDEHAQALAKMKSIDAPDRFEMAVRIGTHGLSQNGQDVPPTNAKFGTTDVTLWRVQRFKIEPGRVYRWINHKIATGQVLQTGTVRPDDRGLLTVPGFFVDREPMGNKLVLTPADDTTAPTIARDKTIALVLDLGRRRRKKTELAYDEYVRACRNPVLCPVVKLPATTFTIAQFTEGGACNRDGSRTFRAKGGFGLGRVRTTVRIPRDGHYEFALRARAVRGIRRNWPVVIMQIGGRYGKVRPPRIVDTTDWGTYRWFAKLDEGKLDLAISTPNDYYMAHQLAGMRKGRELAFADLTIRLLDDPEAARDIRIAPYGVEIPAGLPTRMIATVRNGLGKEMDAPVTWRCETAKIDGGGVLAPCRAGTEHVVTASAGGLEASVTVRVAEAMVETFNEGSGTLRDGWVRLRLGKAEGRWFTPARGHHMLNSLWVRPTSQRARPGEVKSALLWAPGIPWADYEVRADVIICPRVRTPAAGTRGLVFRATDADNHYRLEVERDEKGAAARLVKRVNGAEEVLARKPAPAYAPFDYKTNPLCPGWHGLSEEEAGRRFGAWQLDRFRARVVGDRIRAWVNGTEVFPGGVKDTGFKQGGAGLYAETPSYFDNVEVKAARKGER
jgi:hypothetical protein